MSRALHKFVVVGGWVVPFACAVYDPSLLKGGNELERAGSGSGASAGSGNSGASGGSGASISVAGGGSGSGSSGGTDQNGGGTTGNTGGSTTNNGEGGSGDVGAGGVPSGEAGSGTVVPIGGASGGLVFDTMEDGNNVFFLTSEVRGRWYLSHDATDGEQTDILQLIGQIPDGRDDSARAVHVVASGFTSWGASVGFTFEDNVSGDRVAFDAAEYSAVAFYARVEDGSATAVRVNFPDMNTDPMGEECLDADAGTGDCLDHFGVDLTLTNDFKQYVLVFAQLGQKGWGKIEPGLKASDLLGMEVSWAPNISIDLWIDDVVLLP